MTLEGPGYESNPNRHYECKDCEWLMDAVRDLEQQRRETMEENSRERSLFEKKFPEGLAQCEERFFSRMKTLEHRRNSALDVLAKHQALEHL